jgi:hypothetical protein
MNITFQVDLPLSSLNSLALVMQLSAAHTARMKKEMQRLEVDPPPSVEERAARSLRNGPA